VLLVIRQYEAKSYRLFVDWLVEAYYLRIVLHLSYTPHYTTLQKFMERITGTILERIISSFIIVTKIGQLFVGIDRFIWVQSNSCFTVLYRKNKTYEKKKIHQLSLTADVLQQIICTIKIRCAPTRHDHRFSTTHNKDIRNLTIVSGYR